MAFTLDGRIPVMFGRLEDAGPRDAILREGEGMPGHGQDWFRPVPGQAHPAGCACCAPRNGAGMALARLMLARGRGTGLFFDRVIVAASTREGRLDVERALAGDPVASGFYRLAADGT